MREYGCNSDCGNDDKCGPVPFKVNFAAEALGDGMVEGLYRALVNGGEIELCLAVKVNRPDTCGEDRIYARGCGEGKGKSY